MKARVLIIAGNYYEAEEWRRDGNLAPRDVIIATTPDRLRGLDGRHVVIAKVGTWRQRRDIATVLEYVDILTAIAGR